MTPTLLWDWLAGVSLQVGVLFAIVWVIDRALDGRASPRLLAALWGVVLVKLVLPPTLASPVSIARLLPAASIPTASATDAAATAPAASSAPATAALVAWALGVVAIGAVAAWRERRVRRAWLGAPAVATPAWLASMARALGAGRAVDVHLREGVAGPAVIGVLRPAVVLPAALVATASRAQVEHVLRHELAHVARRDPLLARLTLALQVVYWFHPLVHIAARRLATLREVCCDEAAARRAPDYRRTLLELARPLAARGAPAPAPIGFVHGPGQLVARLRHLERGIPAPRPARERATRAIAVALLVACGVPLARPATAATPDDGPERAASATVAAAAVEAPVTPNTDAGAEPPDVRLDELEGCLQRRYLVLALLARQEAAEAASPEGSERGHHN